MNINASPETVRALTKVFQIAGILDDRCSHPDKARIAAWAEQVERHKLAEGDLLDGLQTYYDSPSERAIQVGDLIHFGRQVRRARIDQEADADREARQDDLATKAADEMRNLMAGAALGKTPRTPRLAAAEDALQCTTDKRTAQSAIREYFAAKTAARKANA